MRHGLAIVWLFIAVGCERRSGSTAQPSASANAVAASAAETLPPQPSARASDDLTGQWSGSYDARHYLIEMSKTEGVVREWAEDKAKEHTGEGTITFRIEPDGSVMGKAKGPLGSSLVSGQVEGKTVRIRLTPSEPGTRSFAGFVVLERERDALKGRLQASTGDSLTVRDAPVELHRPGVTAAPAPPATSSRAKTAP